MAALPIEELSPATYVKLKRTARGLTQRALAQAVGVPQSTIGAIETRRRPVTDDMLRRLERTLQERPSEALHRHKDRVRALFADHGINTVRIFGSVARGQDTVRSDVDFLVEYPPQVSLMTTDDLIVALEHLLGFHVDIVGMYPENRDRIAGALAESIALEDF